MEGTSNDLQMAMKQEAANGDAGGKSEQFCLLKSRVNLFGSSHCPFPVLYQLIAEILCHLHLKMSTPLLLSTVLPL